MIENNIYDTFLYKIKVLVILLVKIIKSKF